MQKRFGASGMCLGVATAALCLIAPRFAQADSVTECQILLQSGSYLDRFYNTKETDSLWTEVRQTKAALAVPSMNT